MSSVAHALADQSPKARLIEVIEVESKRGRGVDDDPVRIVITYFDKDGNVLAERDTWQWHAQFQQHRP